MPCMYGLVEFQTINPLFDTPLLCVLQNSGCCQKIKEEEEKELNGVKKILRVTKVRLG